MAVRASPARRQKRYFSGIARLAGQARQEHEAREVVRACDSARRLCARLLAPALRSPRGLPPLSFPSIEIFSDFAKQNRQTDMDFIRTRCKIITIFYDFHVFLLFFIVKHNGVAFMIFYDFTTPPYEII